MDDNTTEAKRDAITQTARENPWWTHGQVAEEVGVSRGRVSQVLDDDVEAVRDAYREGIEVDATRKRVRDLIGFLEPHLETGVPESVIDRLWDSAEDVDIETIRVELYPAVDDD